MRPFTVILSGLVSLDTGGIGEVLDAWRQQPITLAWNISSGEYGLVVCLFDDLFS